MGTTVGTGRTDARRWATLGVVCVAQLMLALDATIINIALPEAQSSLGFTTAQRQWVITAYALAFGSLLLLGGRISDRWGRRRAMVVGLVGFAVASAFGGAAGSFTTLICARAVQGAFGALLAPATLATLTTTFRDPNERARAFSISGALSGSGAVIGLIVGGALTEWFSWRSCMFVNVAFAAVAVVGTLIVVDRDRGRPRVRVDLVGTVLAGAGFFLLVFGCANAVRVDVDGAASNNWADPVTWGCLVASLVLLGAFWRWQHRTRHPLLPPRILADRTRAGSLSALFVTSFGIFGVSLFLAYYLQRTLGYTPLGTGLAFLPLVLAIGVSSALATARLLPVVGPRPLIPSGMILGAMGMILFTQLPATDQYWSHVFPGLVVLGLGLGLVFAPATATATAGVAPSDAGATSATVNVTQQIGGSIGAALLNSLAVAAATGYVASHLGPSSPAREVRALTVSGTLHGYSVAFFVAAGCFVVGSILSAVLLPSGVPEIDPAGGGLDMAIA